MTYEWRPGECRGYVPDEDAEWQPAKDEADALTPLDGGLRWVRRTDGETTEWAFSAGSAGHSGWRESPDQAYARFWARYIAPGSWGGLTI